MYVLYTTVPAGHLDSQSTAMQGTRIVICWLVGCERLVRLHDKLLAGWLVTNK